MFVYRNTRTSETLEFPDPQPALAQHSWWVLDEPGPSDSSPAPASPAPAGGTKSRARRRASEANDDAGG